MLWAALHPRSSIVTLLTCLRAPGLSYGQRPGDKASSRYMYLDPGHSCGHSAFEKSSLDRRSHYVTVRDINDV